MQNEFSDGKKRREDENPQTLASPEHEHGTEKKKKRKRKRKENREESNQHPEVEVCPKPLVDSVIPIVPLEGKAETTADNSNPTPKRKKKNKNLKDAEQLLTCDRMELDVTKEVGSLKGHAYGNEGLCPKPLLDTPIPIVPQEGNAETTAKNSNPTPKKKKKKAQGVEQDPSVVIGVKPDFTKKERAQEASETAETTTQNPVPIPKKKKKMDVQGAQQQLQTCNPSITTVVEPDLSKVEAAKQGVANGNAVPGINEERPAPDSVLLEDNRRKKKLRGRKKKVLKPHWAEPEPKESDNTEYPQQCSPDSELKIKMRKGVEARYTELPEISIQTTTCLTEAPPIEPAIPGDPCPAIPICSAISIDPEQEMSKKNKGKRKSAQISEGSEPNEPNVKPPETPVQRFVYPTVATSIDLAIPVSATPVDQGKRKRKNKKKRESEKKRSALRSQGAEPNKHDDKLPGNPVQRSICPIAEPSIDPMIATSQAAPVEPAQVDPKQTTKKKTKKRRKSAVKCEVLESQKDNADPTAKIPVQNPKKKNEKPVKKTEGSLICHACGRHGHSFQQCKRLKRLSKNEEVCFFCGKIGHSLGKCGVSQAGGERFAKCLLCFERGHLSNNCFQR